MDPIVVSLATFVALSTILPAMTLGQKILLNNAKKKALLKYNVTESIKDGEKVYIVNDGKEQIELGVQDYQKYLYTLVKTQAKESSKENKKLQKNLDKSGEKIRMLADELEMSKDEISELKALLAIYLQQQNHFTGTVSTNIKLPTQNSYADSSFEISSTATTPRGGSKAFKANKHDNKADLTTSHRKSLPVERKKIDDLSVSVENKAVLSNSDNDISHKNGITMTETKVKLHKYHKKTSNKKSLDESDNTPTEDSGFRWKFSPTTPESQSPKVLPKVNHKKLKPDSINKKFLNAGSDSSEEEKPIKIFTNLAEALNVHYTNENANTLLLGNTFSDDTYTDSGYLTTEVTIAKNG